MLGRALTIALVVAVASVPAEAARKDGTTGKLVKFDTNKSASSIFLAFGSDQSSIAPGGSATLSWASSGARSCNASGAWEGNVGLQGNYETPPLQQDATFTLTCKNKNVSESKTVYIQLAQTEPEPAPEPEPVIEPTPLPEPAPTPTLQLSINETEVEEGAMVTLNWQASNADSCEASGAWSGSLGTAGTESVVVDRYSTFSMNCTSGEQTVSQMVSVAVRNLHITWQPPSENIDGTTLTDLAGFKIYTVESGSYIMEADIATPSGNSASLAKAPGEYMVVMTAYDMEGNESAYSNAVSKVSP
jgi:hypothetical protein